MNDLPGKEKFVNPASLSYPRYQGHSLGEIPGGFGSLTSSTEFLGNPVVLRDRMQELGYLFLPGLLDVGKVLKARASILEKLEEEGCLDPAFPAMDAVARPDINLTFRADLANGNPAVQSLLYDAEMMTFWETFLGTEVLHFDFTWLRAKGPAQKTVTEPHCDTVFMGRGTANLYTAWTPLGDVPFDLGGLMILENSHKQKDLLGTYWEMDVDDYCQNGPEAKSIERGELQWQSDKHNGMFTEDAIGLSKQAGCRWLGTEYKAGDVLIFGMHTLHAAADNQTNRIRLSTDSRYQSALEPVDERWIGPDPVGHGVDGKKGLIC